jgi:hypothetical protein
MVQFRRSGEWVNPSKRGGMDRVFREATLPARRNPILADFFLLVFTFEIDFYKFPK